MEHTNRRNRHALVLVAGAALLAAGTLVAAGPGRDRGGFDGGFGHGPGAGRLMHALERLDLNEEQRSEIRELLGDSRDEVRERMGEMHAAQRDLERVVEEVGAGSSEARRVATEVGNAAAELALLRAETRSRVRSVLTPEQRVELDRMADERRERVRDRHDRRRPAR